MTLNPFDKSLPENYAFKSKDHEQMLSRLDYLKNTRGIGLFTAPRVQARHLPCAVSLNV